MPSVSLYYQPRRATEASGKCYDFVTDAEFAAMVQHGDFLNMRASLASIPTDSKEVLEESRKRDSIWCWKSMYRARQVSRSFRSRSDFYLPPSREELERRLRSRGQDADEEIAALGSARGDCGIRKYYDYCVVNDEWNAPGARCRR